VARRSGDLDRPAAVDATAAPTSRHAELVRALRSQGDEEEDRSLFFEPGGRTLAEKKAARGYAVRLNQHVNATLPEGVRRLLKAHLRRLHVYTTSAGTIHRGESTETKGLYNWRERRIEVFGEGDHVPEDTVRHEVGHAFDHVMTAARNIDQMRAAQFRHKSGHAALSNTPAFQKLFTQYRHDVPDGWSSPSREMFAEAFSLFYGPPDQQAWLERKIPDLHRYFDGLADEVSRFIRDVRTGS
jgi:hypothetical protein